MKNTQGTILVTGGAGFIGSHTCVELLNHGYQVLVLDNLTNSHPNSLKRVSCITGRELIFVEGDACSRAILLNIFDRYHITGVIHLAALKAVGESVIKPIVYYRNNIDSLLTLIETMIVSNVKTLVFSSSANVYGNPVTVPIYESSPLFATNPYGQTKLIGEKILSDLASADPTWRIATLRYFNPVGAHESGLLGEHPLGIPSNLMPFVARVAAGHLPKLQVFGCDWPTPDGTGVRDYIHVVDLAKGHLAALDGLRKLDHSFTVNLGTGHGYSVLQIISAFEEASGRSVPYTLVERRPGDIASCYASTVEAKRLLGWYAQYDLPRMCVDHWRWQVNNPNGFCVE
ncbi:UDP-glucose 4-epimerase GalE [Candidatus Pandoraea novymonadis]|uniref:UDP-glucose 4-epimerase n=1 Tax=Candidatus Pandoraea novymonadis TaxID=1808959 RepID=A0ABX5FEG6_9BURK|nr:UDP-glucose 4-epimerase GalE [Candidatus Pandoraea novymonadis]PSB92108.1 UDP-glucose 4-epimerase [Candidatus Pandoraea novymonadis]